MASTTIRVDTRIHQVLRDLSKEEHKTITQVITDAVEQYQKEKFWRELEESLTRLRADPIAWQDYQDEIALWDTLAGDGLEHEDPYYPAGEEGDA